jgi:hypothetical protein
VADAVTNAANDLTEAIKGNMDKQLKNVDIIELERLATIFQKAAEQVAENDVQTTRVPYTRETSRRVSELIHEEQDTESANVPRVDITSDNPVDETPRYNTRHQKRLQGTPMTDALLTVMELAGKQPCPQRLASRKFSSQVLLEMMNAVMDLETGDMMEYRHLLKNPKYREVWSKAFGKEIGRLAQGQEGVVDGTDALDFIHPDDVPTERRKDITYA